MDLNSASFSGLPTYIITQLEQNLQEPVSRELHAFCHLCLPAASELLRASKGELSHLNRACKETINQWCCCARDYAAQPDGPSLTTRGTALIGSFISLKRRIANMISPDKKSRRVLHSHKKRSRRVSWSSYFPLFSRKKTAEGFSRHLESLGDVLGA